MTVPIPEGGIPLQPVVPLESSESKPVPFSGEIKTVHFLAGATFALPKQLHLKLFHLQNAVFKVITRHPVVSGLIKKFDPMISQMAVLSNKGMGIQKVEKPDSNTPTKETGRQRDEIAAGVMTSARGEGKGNDVVNIQVFKGKMEQPNPQVAKENLIGQEQGQQGAIAVEKVAPVTQQPSKNLALVSKPLTKQQVQGEKSSSGASALLKPSEAGPQIQVQPPTEKLNVVEFSSVKSESKVSEPNLLKQKNDVEKQHLASEKLPVAAKPELSKNKGAEPGVIKPNSKSVSENKEDIGTSLPSKPETPHKLPASQSLHKEHLHPQLSRLTAEESIAAPITHRFFTSMNNNTNIFVPPWLAALLPELERNAAVRRGGKGREKDSGLQNPHKLSDILFMVLSASLAGANTLGAIFQHIESREKWLQVVLGLQHGLPSRQLLFWLLSTMNVNAFDLTLKKWLNELREKTKLPSQLMDIYVWQTPLGYMIGQTIHPNSFKQDPISICNAFRWKKSVVMIKAAEPYEDLLTKIHEKGAFYIIEATHELESAPEGSERYESYWEGQERIIVQTWKSEKFPISYLATASEIFDSKGPTHLEAFYLSNLENPAAYFFDLSRIQRTYEKKAYWLLNVALTLPSVEDAIHQSTATLNRFRGYAIELILKSDNGVSAVEPLMKKAAADEKFLLQLIQK